MRKLLPCALRSSAKPLSATSGAPVPDAPEVKHHPPVLGLCLSLLCMQPSLLFSVCLFFLLVRAALKLGSPRIDLPRLCRFAVFLIRTSPPPYSPTLFVSLCCSLIQTIGWFVLTSNRARWPSLIAILQIVIGVVRRSDDVCRPALVRQGRREPVDTLGVDGEIQKARARGAAHACLHTRDKAQ